MSGVRFLLGKDLRILRRSPLLVSLLVAYPVLIAVLIGLALSKGPDKPRVAILNQLPQQSGEVAIAGTTVNPRRLRRQAVRVDRARCGCARARRPCARSATATCWRRSSSRPTSSQRLQQTISLSGTGPKPAVEVLYNAEDPVKQQFVRVDDRRARRRPQQGGVDQADADRRRATSTSCCRAASSPSWAATSTSPG